jgi:multiple sugar transport system permease protein/sn-glycerol 3-phosphate transport system permease protein
MHLTDLWRVLDPGRPAATRDGSSSPDPPAPGDFPPTGPGPRHGPAARHSARRLGVALPFVLPSLAGVVVFLVVPVVIVLVLSFFQWNFLTSPRWVAFANFATMTKDDHVFHALAVTAYYVLWNIPIQTVVALGLAILLNRRLPGLGVFRAACVLPYMSTPVAMAVVWSWIFNPQSGLINHLLLLVGVHGPDWLGSMSTALPVVAMVSNWQYAGYNMLFFLAGMQTIPAALYEAASIDGAGPVKRFFRVTLPLLNPTMLFVLVTDVIGSFQVFDTVYVMTQGGPGSATDVINYQIYSTAFQNFDVGSASAMSLLLFGVILVVTFLQFRFFRNRTTYEVS